MGNEWFNPNLLVQQNLCSVLLMARWRAWNGIREFTGNQRRKALPCTVGFPPQQSVKHKPSRGGAGRYSYPQFSLPGHGVQEPEEVELLGRVQLGHGCHQVPQAGEDGLWLLLVERGQHPQQHRVPWGHSRDTPGSSCHRQSPGLGRAPQHQHSPADTT